MKIYARSRTWIMMAILLFAVGVSAVFLHRYFDVAPSADWQTGVRLENQKMQQQLDDPKKYRLSDTDRRQLELNVEINQYALDHNRPPHQDTGWSFMLTMTEILPLATIFSAVVAGDIVASEFSWGTVKLLLIRPVNRTKILWAKYSATVLFMLGMMLIMVVASVLVGGLVFGFVGIDQPYIFANANGVHQLPIWQFALIEYGAEALKMLMIVTISFMISAAFRSSSLAISLSLLILFAGSTGIRILAGFSWAKYVLFANYDLMQYVNGLPFAEHMSIGFSLAVMAAYFVLLHAIAWGLFVKRDVAG